MDWQVFRDAKESELAEHRAFVEQTLQWRVPGFHWSAASVKQWYEERSQWPEEIQRAVEFLYQYDYPLRVLEEQIVHDESWLWNDYDGMRKNLWRPKTVSGKILQPVLQTRMRMNPRVRI